MKRNFKIASVIILGAMLFLSACSSGNGDLSSKGKDAGVNSQEEPVELNVAFPAGAVPKDLALVQEEINKITKQKINATVKLTVVNFGDWEQQTNLMLSSGEKLDLMAILGKIGIYNNLVSKGQLIVLDKLFEQHGQGITDAFDPADLNAAKIEGSIYGVPSIRDFAAGFSIVMRKDLVDKYQIDISKIHTLDDVETALKTIKDNEPNVTPLVPNGVGASILDTYVNHDMLGDNIGVLQGFDDLKVVNYYESQEYEQLLKKLRNWYTSGLILKDATTNRSSQFDLIKSNRAFAYLNGYKPGIEQQESISNGIPMVAATLVQPVSTTLNIANVMWGIPINSKLPEKSMEFLNLMYTDKDIINLLDWGIEGKHYVVKSDNVIDYPEGVDAQTTGYNMNMGWLLGNQFLSYVFNGNDPNMWKKMDEFNKSAKKSVALGFTFDASKVKSEYAAVTNVTAQYKLPLETGSVDPDKVLPEFISKLKTAGIDKIIAEKQKQLNEWAKINK